MRTLLSVALLASPAVALDPADVVVVFNPKADGSKDVADHYRAKRNVPPENLVGLDLPTTEDITRADYDGKLAAPLRAALKDRKDKVKVILTVYGVPLRVGRQQPTAAEAAEADALKPELDAHKATVAELQKAEKPDKVLIAAAQAKVRETSARVGKLTHSESHACVDSELMLLWWPEYPLDRWVPNPLNWRFPSDRRAVLPRVLITARLDGPTPAIAKRLVDDALTAEATGLQGKAYIDARGIRYDAKTPTDGGTGYAGYDESFREAAGLLKAGKVAVVLDDEDPLFAPGSCPDAALYGGWYALTRYTPCCKFVPGAVAWHLASGEAASLRNPDTKQWCVNLLKDGAAVTMGPVAEPYTVGFPKPAEFFGFLATGHYTVAECYARTALLTSWMTVFVGDPLYNPYAKAPKLKEEAVTPSPAGSGNIFK